MGAVSWNLLVELEQAGHIYLLLFCLPRCSESDAVSVAGGFPGKLWEDESLRNDVKFVSAS